MCLDNTSYSYYVLNNASYKVSIDNVSHVYLDWIRLNRYIAAVYIYIYHLCKIKSVWAIKESSLHSI